MRPCIAAPAILFSLGATTVQGALAQQQTKDKAFIWSGPVAAGRWIRIENLNGSISFGAASGPTVEVVASEEWNHGDPSIVHFDVQKFGPGGEDVTICALWSPRSTCNEKGTDNHNDNGTRNNDVSVQFRVLVPRGVKVGGGAVNGSITLVGATADVDLSSVNGKVELSASDGPIKASTVNGDVVAHVSHVDAKDNLSFTTVNGSIVADLPTDLSASVELTTVTGALKSDYDITMNGRVDPRHLAAQIGKVGGPKIKITTVNGSIELHRR